MRWLILFFFFFFFIFWTEDAMMALSISSTSIDLSRFSLLPRKSFLAINPTNPSLGKIRILVPPNGMLASDICLPLLVSSFRTDPWNSFWYGTDVCECPIGAKVVRCVRNKWMEKKKKNKKVEERLPYPISWPQSAWKLEPRLVYVTMIQSCIKAHGW